MLPRSDWAAPRRLQGPAGRPMLRAPSQGATLTDSRYSSEPDDPAKFTGERDRLYTASAGLYAGALRIFPVWRR